MSAPAPLAGAPPPARPIDDTASTQLVRLVRDVVSLSQPDPVAIARIPGTDDAVLGGELHRIPLTSLVRLWELLARNGRGAGLAVAAAAPLGTLATWDYLVTTGPTLAAALRAAQPYHRLVTAAAEGFALREDGGLTVEFRTTAGDPAVAAVINEYVLAYYLRRAREATGRAVTPAQVSFAGPAPREQSALVDAFGARRIEFGARADSITFAPDDAHAPLTRADPALAHLLRDHADLVLATARPIPGPLDAFRAALDAALDDGEPALPAVARRLATSPRTLQRRLAAHGTTWRQELDLARHERARALLAGGRTTAAVAERLGFTDDRALRKASRRWRGVSPTGLQHR
ncbi:AraC family transcriptional regulator [Nocardia farcinica]|uniref:Putative transcriptional regulator n=1 Tax=Nocardia farcinica (strain IFM 10152) TaxID=247156 RepID=Q5YNX3_NOCFA|nr:AraC family transcriptional regulator [Nocardia farcinica]BAD60118.1 putative transcriptional regulator [Nocardia farcinica IFM 10152]